MHPGRSQARCAWQVSTLSARKELNVKSQFRLASSVRLALAMLPILVLLLAACGGGQPTPQVLVITATFTPQVIVQVVTATFTPIPEGGQGVAPTVQEVTATLPPTPEPTATEAVVSSGGGLAISTKQSSSIPAPTATLIPRASDTPLPPSPLPSDTPLPAPSNTPRPAAPPAATLNRSWLVVYTVCQPPRSNDSYSLWQMRGDGSEAEKVILTASEPAFDANGKRMVYYKWIEGLRVIYLDRNPQQEIISRGDGNASFPSMSPDGNQIVYHQIPSNWQGQFTLRVCDVNGQNDRSLTPGSRPAWSPKGNLIAYDSCNQQNQCGIFVVQPNGQGLRQLTTDAGGGPAWSPDGKKIAYASAADGDFEIYVMNADGSGKIQITKNKGNDALPTWSPDGNFIYYRSDNDGKVWGINVVGATGSNPRKLVNAPACDLWNFEKLTVTK